MTVWVLGAGQLGAMLRHAGMPLNLEVRPVALDSEEIPAPRDNDLVTPEIEHWPDTAATRALAQHPNLVNRPVFARLADRLTQKQLIDSLGLATAPWREVDATCNGPDLHRQLGPRVLLKQRRGGYDGKGQLWLREPENTALPEAWRGTSIAEQGIDFDEEVSLVGMRERGGQRAFYPLALNLHTNGVLTASIAPLPRLSHLQQQAETMLGALLDHLDYVGVMAMECFRVGDRLLINELAPRVHNSGHWTQAGCSVSQFESHLRATCGLPLVTPACKGLTVMVNLLGIERDNRWLSVPEVELHWYGKEVRPGRKVGHLNLCAPQSARLKTAVTALAPFLPDSYTGILQWIETNLGSD